MQYPFINIHTHTERNIVEAHTNLRIFNIAQPQFPTLRTLPEQYISAGIHPWFLTAENAEKDLEILSENIDNQKLVAIGEAGLDRLKGADLALQIHVLNAQINLAHAANLPIIIHCVKAYNELIEVFRKYPPSVSTAKIVHGYNQNAHIHTLLLKHNFCLSLGAALIAESPNAVYALKNTPPNRLFLETDTADIHIEEVYKKAATLLDIDINYLKSIIYENVMTVFHRISELPVR